MPPSGQEQGGQEKGQGKTNKKRASAAALIDAFVDQYNADRQEYNRREKQRVFREWLTIIGLFVAAGFAFWQWRELRSTDHTLRETLVASNRAWISPQTVRLTSDVEIGSRAASIQIIYENVGRFPALDFSHAETGGARLVPVGFRDWEGLDFGDNQTCKGLTPRKGGPTIYPSQHFGGELSYAVAPDPDKNPAAVIQELLNGRRLLWMQGCFSYLAFDSPRYSTFCFYLQPDPPRPILAWPFKTCPKGNHAT